MYENFRFVGHRSAILRGFMKDYEIFDF